MELEVFEQELKRNSNIVMYGSGVVAYGINAAIKTLYGILPQLYVVSDISTNPSNIEGCQVELFDKVADNIRDSLIIIATPELYHEEIKHSLVKKKIYHFLIIDSHLEYLVMAAYYKKIGKFPCIMAEKDMEDASNENVAVYVARSHRDTKLKEAYCLPKWAKTIQVGTALTSERGEETTDDVGENISHLNHLYGELTASYWIWKNDRHNIKGLFHYRRVLLLGISELNEIKQGNVDVILPLPFLCCGNTSWQYGRYLCKEDVDIMWNVLSEVSAEYYEAAKRILSDKYLYNYNILVAKKEVFDDYCSWLFLILDRIEKECEIHHRKRADRYLGRIGEILTSLYFLYNKRQWKIMHGEKKWIV